MYECSVVSDFLQAPWTTAPQAPLPMEFSRQGYWSGLPFPPPGDLPNAGIKSTPSVSPALEVGFFTTNAIWEAYTHTHTHTHTHTDYPWKDIQEIANSSFWEQGLGVSGCKIEVRKHFSL